MTSRQPADPSLETSRPQDGPGQPVHQLALRDRLERALEHCLDPAWRNRIVEAFEETWRNPDDDHG